MPPAGGGVTTPAVVAALADVGRRIADAGATPSTVQIVAVTKGFGPAAVTAAREAGIADVGENYAQELVAKWDAVGEGGKVRWHFLGSVQRNKVPLLAPVVSCWQGLSRRAEGEAIAKRRPGAAVMVEVELTGAAGRNGCRPDDVPHLVGALRSLDLEVRGLMTVAPRERTLAHAAFRTVRWLADDLALPDRSMGMSDDFELAVQEGATMVRLGRVLFGDRPARPVTAP